jgi:hypothetical protein
MYRNKTATLDDVFHVGPNKPLGYKLLKDLNTLSKVDPVKVEKQLQDKGLITITLTGNECAMSGGALYAWDDRALSDLLLKNQKTLLANNWPIDTRSFVKRSAIEWAQEKTALFDVIADAFGDTTHPGRTNIKALSCKDSFNKAYIKKLQELETQNSKNIKPLHKGPKP